jgi:hypothetical protein
MVNALQNEILIRRACADDGPDLVRLAALDSAASLPPAPLLVAELDGVLGVALSLRDGSVIADPFRPTAEVVELLRLHAVAGKAKGPTRNARAWVGRVLEPLRWPAF